MHVNPAAARLSNPDLARTVANADTARSQRPEFTHALRAHKQPNLPRPAQRNEPSATPVAKTETPHAKPAEAAPEKTTLTGDINNDGRVDVFDFSRLLAALGTDDPGADLHQDGIVDELDVAVFRKFFGNTA